MQPSDRPALEAEPTQRALKRYRRGAAATLGIGLVPTFALFVFLMFGEFREDSFLETVAVWAVGLSLVPLVGGTFATVNALRIRYILARHPWTVWACQFREIPMSTPNGAPTLVLLEPKTGTQHAFKGLTPRSDLFFER